MSARGQRLRLELAQFLKQYARKTESGHDPNDRRYNRKIEAAVKRMRAEDLDVLIRDDEELDRPPPQANRKRKLTA